MLHLLLFNFLCDVNRRAPCTSETKILPTTTARAPLVSTSLSEHFVTDSRQGVALPSPVVWGMV